VIGALLVATWDTYGPLTAGKLYALIRDTERAFGKDFATVVASMTSPYPEIAGAATMRAQHVSRAVTAPRPQHRGVGGAKR
jgi:hypothetical protein